MTRIVAGLRRALTRRTPPRLFRPVGIVTIPATNDPFVVREKFMSNPEAVVQIVSGKNFEAWFSEKIEEPIAETRLQYADLIEPTTNEQILAELGRRAEITLGQMYALLERQSRGQEGALLVNTQEPQPHPIFTDFVTLRWWRPSAFYVRDINNKLRIVTAIRFATCWLVDAETIESSREWDNESRMFFHSS
ncbi:MAG: hypothetical protein Q7R48_00800 [bacterium]|nr:hypothetical protein [bacterium]